MSSTPVPSSAPSAARTPVAETHAAEPGPQIDWAAVDQALEQINSLDILELATHIATQAQIKGPKEAYNEAGSVRFQIARMRQQYDVLKQNICAERLEVKEQQIKALEWANSKKRVLAADERKRSD